MSCEKPVIAPITDECCFSCYTQGRGAYQAPVAIVLHEVDEHIEALNNRMENCCNDDPKCHASFHYGVGHDGRIINFVDIDNTAWAFDPVNSDQNCGICGWSIATGEGVNVDPNLYTINIAVSTGISAFSHHGRQANHYTDNQYDGIVRLVGWLAETYGIVVNQNTIWRHCDELDDFPSCSCCDTYSQFLESVQDCIDTDVFENCLPFCDCIDPAEPTTAMPCDLDGWLPVACDCPECDCDCAGDCICGCNEITTDLSIGPCKVSLTVVNLPFDICRIVGVQGASIKIDEDNPINVVTMTFEEPQNNLALGFADVDLIDVIDFTTAPTSVDGDLILAANQVTSGVDDGAGNVVWTGPITTVTFSYSVTDDPPLGAEEICINQFQSDECYCERPAVGISGETTFVSCNGFLYTLPDQDQIGQIMCDELAGLSPAGVLQPDDPVVLADCTTKTFPTPATFCELLTAEGLTPTGNLVDGAVFLNDACELVTLDFCELISTAYITAPVPIVPDTTVIMGIDCIPYTAPGFCTLLTAETIADAGQLTLDTCDTLDGGTLVLGADCNGYTIPYIWDPAAAPVIAYDPIVSLSLVQFVTVDPNCYGVISLQVPACTNNPVIMAIGIDVSGDLGFGPIESDGVITSRATTIDISTLQTDRLVYVDATSGNVTVTLTDPAGWCNDQIRIKRTDTSANTVTVASAALIDGSASIVLATPGPFSANAGEAAHMHWDGSTWWVI